MRVVQRSLFTLSLLLTTCLVGCASNSGAPVASMPDSMPASASAEASVEKDLVFYFAGTVTTSSPDGKTPYGPVAPGLAKRIYHREAGTLEEHVLFQGKMESMVMARVDQTGRFEVPGGEAFAGNIIYNGGKDWHWTTWTYDLVMADGSGKIEGTGMLQDGVMSTEKYFVDPTGVRRARIVEVFKPITEEEYEALRAEVEKK